MQVTKENRCMMYKSDNPENSVRYNLYLNIEGKQYRASVYANVAADDSIWYSGPVQENLDGLGAEPETTGAE